MALNRRQQQFVIEYLVDFNGTQAAIRAGYSPNGAANHAFELLTNAVIVAAVENKQAERAAAADLTAEWVLRQWKQIAEADPNELIYTALECCRHCYGVANNYQWTEFEYARAVMAAANHRCSPRCEQRCANSTPPDASGGFGYDPNLEPNRDCPVCHGRGLERVCLKDTRRARGSARRLYAGVKQTQHGIEIKMRDQDGALKNIAQFFHDQFAYLLLPLIFFHNCVFTR